jgi:WD40 repeat protein
MSKTMNPRVLQAWSARRARRRFSCALVACASALGVTTAIADPVEVPLYYTTFAGGANVWRVLGTYTGNGTAGNGTFTLSGDTNIASTGGADGIVLNPNNGQLLIGGQGNAIHQVNPTTGTFTTAVPGVNAFHLAVDPSKTVVWASSIPGALSSTPINPFGGPGTVRTLSGSDTAITSLAFAPSGTVYYTNAGASGFGNFGTIDLGTGVTSRLLSDIPAAHGMVYDPFSNALILGGSNHISQVSLATNTIVHDLIVSGNTFDQGAVDGDGHLFWADNGGRFFFLDYSTTGDVSSPTNFASNEFFKSALDDVAPLIGAGGTITPPVPEPETYALMLAGLAALSIVRRRKAEPMRA